MQPGTGEEYDLAGAISHCQPFRHSAALQGETRGSRGRSLEGIAATRANVVRFERSLGTGFTGRSQILPVPPVRLCSLTTPAGARTRVPHGCLALRSCGREFADSAPGGHSGSWVVRADPMSEPRQGLGSPHAH